MSELSTNAVMKALMDGRVTKLMPETTDEQIRLSDNSTLESKLADMINAINLRAKIDAVNAMYNELIDILDSKSSVSEVEEQIAALKQDILGDMPSDVYDTFTELYKYISEHEDVAEALTEAIGLKADRSEVDTAVNDALAESKSYTDTEIAKAFAGSGSGGIEDAAEILYEAKTYTDTEVADALSEAKLYAGAGDATLKLTVLSESKDYTDLGIAGAVADAQEYTDNKVAAALSEAKSYADTGDDNVLSGAEEYANTVGSTTLTLAKSYTDGQLSVTLDQANSYADLKSSDNKTYTDDEVSSALTDAKSHADAKAVSVLTEAKSYTNTKFDDIKTYIDGEILDVKDHIDYDVVEALNNAKDYADAQDALNLTNAKDYTDLGIAGAVADAQEYTDNKIKALVDGAPESMNTLKELSAAIDENSDILDALNKAIPTYSLTKSNGKIVLTGSNGDSTSVTDSDTVTGVTVTGTGNAVTGISATNGQVTVSKDKTFLTAHPTVSKSTDSTSEVTPAHGGSFTAIDSITRDGNGHVTKVNTKTVSLPGETQLSKGTDTTATKKLSHGGTFTAVTDTAVSGHKITDTTTTFTLPSETLLSKGDDTSTSSTLSHGGGFAAITDLEVNGHTITPIVTKFTLPSDNNTDVSVKQGRTTTSDYRPVLLGLTNDTDTTVLDESVTGQAYVSNEFYAQPSTGLFHAKTFEGDLKGTANIALTLDGMDASIPELNSLSGIASNVQDQLDALYEQDSSVLVNAKDYADLGIAGAVSDAQEYADGKLSEAKSYADTKASTTLSSAKSYSDSNYNNVLSDTKTYTDGAVAAALSDAMNHSDNNAASTLSEAKTYTNTKTKDVLSSAKSYTDSKIEDIGGTNTELENRIDDMETENDTRFSNVLSRFRYPFNIDGSPDVGIAFCESINSGGGFLTLNFNNGGCIITCAMAGAAGKYGQLRGVIVNGVGGDKVYIANIQDATLTTASIYIYCVNHPTFTGSATVNLIYIWEWLGGE